MCRHVGGGLRLEDVIVDHPEVVSKLNPQIASSLDVVLNVDESVDSDMDGKPV